MIHTPSCAYAFQRSPGIGDTCCSISTIIAWAKVIFFRFATVLPSIVGNDKGCTGSNFRRFVNTEIRIQILYEPDEEVQVKVNSRVCYINYDKLNQYWVNGMDK